MRGKNYLVASQSTLPKLAALAVLLSGIGFVLIYPQTQKGAGVSAATRTPGSIFGNLAKARDGKQ
jgi:hypothetical protein